MEVYDILMIAVLIGAILFGAWKGMAWQIASLASFALSYAVAMRFRGGLAPYIKADEPWNRFIAMLILFLGTSFVVWMAFRIVAGNIDRLKLREFDRQAGAVFGAAKGVLLCVMITFFVVTLSVSGRDHVLNSRSGFYIAKIIDRADAVMPEEVHDVLGPYLHQLEKGLDPDAEKEQAADRYHGKSAAPASIPPGDSSDDPQPPTALEPAPAEPPGRADSVPDIRLPRLPDDLTDRSS
jgi:membrane protein required for colicin V production